MADKLSAVKGMNDILPPDSARWEALEASVREVMRLHAYRNIRTPIVKRQNGQEHKSKKKQD